MPCKALLIFFLSLLVCIISVSRRISFEQVLVKRQAHFVPSGRPVAGRLSSFYGIRRHPLRHRRQFHQGIDIAGAAGESILATAPGIVRWVGRKAGYGKCVMVDHGHGWETLYAHLQSSPVKVGSFVPSQKIIGRMGSSGFTTGPHLHYEVRYLDHPQDPLHFISESGQPMISRLEGSYPETSFHPR